MLFFDLVWNFILSLSLSLSLIILSLSLLYFSLQLLSLSSTVYLIAVVPPNVILRTSNLTNEVNGSPFQILTLTSPISSFFLSLPQPWALSITFDLIWIYTLRRTHSHTIALMCQRPCMLTKVRWDYWLHNFRIIWNNVCVNWEWGN